MKNRKITALLFASVALSACDMTFTAQNSRVALGTEYLLTLEKLDSSRTEIVTSRCDTIPGIALRIAWEKEGDDYVAAASLANDNPEYVIKALEGPVVNGLDYDLEEFNLIMPVGMGQLFRKCPADGDDRTPLPRELKWKEQDGVYSLAAGYPSRNMSMQWCAFASDKRGLYLASHDGQYRAKEFNIRYHASSDTYSASIRHLFTCFPGERYDVPQTRLRPYSGTWHAAADYYRSWFETRMEYAEQPRWLKESSGWMLAITKQQNEEIMYDYDEFAGTLCDAAEERGLDIVGLFGWAHGGHDRFYPDYLPDPKRGGETALRKALEGIRNRGLRSILYVNGQLIDQNGTRYWPDTGRYVTMVDKSGAYFSETWHKYYDAPARKHGRACFGCEAWRKRMLSLARTAHDYGADGIIYDQLATRSPAFCYAANHGHTVPAVTVERDRLEMIREIRREMSAVDPEFIIMTEGVADYELGCINIFHGCSFDVYPPDQRGMEERLNGAAGSTWFPEMLTYTFPKLLMTVRNPAPVTSRNMSNFVLVYHLKNELETRYMADVNYLKTDRIPQIGDYSNVTTKPDIDLVCSQDPVRMREYQKVLADFQTEYQDLLRLGDFRDDSGIEFEGSHSLATAKAFVSGGRTGVIVWNVSADEPLDYSVRVPGKSLVKAVSPEKSPSAGSALAPESIDLLIFE